MAEAIKGCGCTVRVEYHPQESCPVCGRCPADDYLDDSRCAFAEARAAAERLEAAKVAIRAELVLWPDSDEVPYERRLYRYEYRSGLQFALDILDGRERALAAKEAHGTTTN